MKMLVDLYCNVDKKGRGKRSAIVDGMNSLCARLVVRGSATVKEVSDELYAKYPFFEPKGLRAAGRLHGQKLIQFT